MVLNFCPSCREMLKEYRGIQIYIPMHDHDEIEKRNEQIRLDYKNGSRIEEQARKYNLSGSRIKQILSSEKKISEKTT